MESLILTIAATIAANLISDWLIKKFNNRGVSCLTVENLIADCGQLSFGRPACASISLQ